MPQLLLDMQKRVHDYVVADKGTAKEALDLLVKDWTKVFKEAGQERSDRTGPSRRRFLARSVADVRG